MHLSLPEWFPLFILASSACKSLQCLISSMTQGGKGGHLFRLPCSVVLWGGRSTANKHHWHVRGALAVRGPPWVCPAHACALSRSTLLRLQAALQGNCAKWALGCVHFPGLSCSGSGSRVLHTGTDSVGLCFVPFPALSSSGDQVLGECTVPGGLCVLITSLAVTRLPLCLRWGAGPARSRLTLLWYSLNSLFCGKVS